MGRRLEGQRTVAIPTMRLMSTLAVMSTIAMASTLIAVLQIA